MPYEGCPEPHRRFTTSSRGSYAYPPISSLFLPPALPLPPTSPLSFIDVILDMSLLTGDNKDGLVLRRNALSPINRGMADNQQLLPENEVPISILLFLVLFVFISKYIYNIFIFISIFISFLDFYLYFCFQFRFQSIFISFEFLIFLFCLLLFDFSKKTSTAMTTMMTWNESFWQV